MGQTEIRGLKRLVNTDRVSNKFVLNNNNVEFLKASRFIQNGKGRLKTPRTEFWAIFIPNMLTVKRNDLYLVAALKVK